MDFANDHGDTASYPPSEIDIILRNANKEIIKLRQEICRLSNELKRKDELLAKYTDMQVVQLLSPVVSSTVSDTVLRGNPDTRLSTSKAPPLGDNLHRPKASSIDDPNLLKAVVQRHATETQSHPTVFQGSPPPDASGPSVALRGLPREEVRMDAGPTTSATCTPQDAEPLTISEAWTLDTDLLHHQKTLPQSPLTRTTTGVPQQQQTTTGVPQHQQTTTGVPQQQQTTTGVPQHQQTTTGVPQHQQTTTGVPQHQQTTTGFPQHQQTTTGFPQHQQTTTGVPQHQQTTTGVPQHQQTTVQLAAASAPSDASAFPTDADSCEHGLKLQDHLHIKTEEEEMCESLEGKQETDSTSVAVKSEDEAEEAECSLLHWRQSEENIKVEPSGDISEGPEAVNPRDVCHVYQPPMELPSHWMDQLPSYQQDWIRNSVFNVNPRTGKLELVSQLKLWWYPPQPALIQTQPPPSPHHFFCRPLFLWMPQKMWRFPLVCVGPACDRHRLTAEGIHTTVRKVLDIDGWYDLATECLECKRCSKKYPAWSEDILGQLDMGHRSKFPALLTNGYSCGVRVLRMMRERMTGITVTQLHKTLQEQHSEAWMERVLQYLTACEPFTKSTVSQPSIFAEPPRLPALPKPKWLLEVYARDVFSRLQEVKAKITSIFGSVLKMDSTNKVTKKVAGAAAAAWCTNVVNESDQVLVSVLTFAEGQSLDAMAAGLVRRYREAGEAPPKVMYVDRGCCSQGGLCRVKAMFAGWEELHVRLDIWHFMRRFAAAVTTETHPLYGIFMARLSACIFQWDPRDVAALRRAKKGELAARRSVGNISEEAVTTSITQGELALSCRRRTRGVEETGRLIASLIGLFDSVSGKDLLGVPLLDHKRIQHIWKEEQKHLGCIQDPQDFPLYVKTGTLKKGGVELSCYRCVRGSTSLKAFHLHLNRFIPGTSASDAHFQAYLLEGLMRWNDAAKETPSICSSSSALREAVNRLSQTVLRRSWDQRYRTARAYTGELLGIEYLYNQTGQELTAVVQNPEEEEEEVQDEDVQDEGFVEESMEDMTVPLLYEDDSSRALRSKPSSLTRHQAPTSPADVPSSTLSHQAQGAVKKKLELLPPTSGPQHQLVRPPNLQGQAPHRRPTAATRERLIAPTPTAPTLIAPTLTAPTPTAPTLTAPTLTAPGTAQPMSAHRGNLVLNLNRTLSVVLAAPGVSTPSPGRAPHGHAAGPSVPRSTERNRRRRALEQEVGVSKRKYVRTVAYNTCGKCGQPKTKDFGHSRHGNATFCPVASQGKSLEAWLKERRNQRRL